MNHTCQHFRRLLPIGRFISQSAYNPGLIVVTPEQRVPAVPFLHLYLPLNKELFQLLIIRRHQRPFIPVLVIHFQMVEIKAHGEFLFLRRRIPDTVFDRRGRHLAHRHEILNPRIPHQFLQILMNMGAVAVKSPSVSQEIILHHLRLGNQIDHVKTECLYAFVFPEPQNLL